MKAHEPSKPVVFISITPRTSRPRPPSNYLSVVRRRRGRLRRRRPGGSSSSLPPTSAATPARIPLRTPMLVPRLIFVGRHRSPFRGLAFSLRINRIGSSKGISLAWYNYVTSATEGPSRFNCRVGCARAERGGTVMRRKLLRPVS